MRLGAEVAADQERLAQLPQIALGRLGDGVLVALGGVPAQEPDGRQPQVREQEVGRHEGQHDAPLGVPPAIAFRSPALGVHGVDVECQEDGDHRCVEVEVAQVEHPPGDGLEPRTRAELDQHIADPAAEELGDQRRAHQVEDPATERRDDQRDDLVLGLRADEQADADVGGPEQRGGEIAGEHRSPVEVAEQGHRDRQGNRQRQRHHQQAPAGEELADDELRAGGRDRHHELERSRAPFIAPHAHRDRRREEDQQHGQPLEHRPHVGDVAGEERFPPEEYEQRHREIRRQEEVGDGRREEVRQLLAGDPRGHVNSHRRPPAARPR